MKMKNIIREAMHFEQCGRAKATWLVFVAFLRQQYALAYCARFGHDTESVADGENGSEDIWCNRCGWSHHAQF
jgi:hypothetical protein